MTVYLPSYTFPLASNQTPDQPCLLVPSKSIVALYNRAQPSDKHRKTVTKTVRRWFQEAAKQSGWSQVKFYLEFNEPRSLGALLILKATDS